MLTNFDILLHIRTIHVQKILNPGTKTNFVVYQKVHTTDTGFFPLQRYCLRWPLYSHLQASVIPSSCQVIFPIERNTLVLNHVFSDKPFRKCTNFPVLGLVTWQSSYNFLEQLLPKENAILKHFSFWYKKYIRFNSIKQFQSSAVPEDLSTFHTTFPQLFSMPFLTAENTQFHPNLDPNGICNFLESS